MTKRLLVSMDDERYEDLRRLAFEKKAPMADLVRYAIERVFEDQLDAVAAQRGLEHYLKHPEDYVPFEDVMKELGIAVPHRRPSRSRTPTEKTPGKGRGENHVGDRSAGRRPATARH